VTELTNAVREFVASEGVPANRRLVSEEITEKAMLLAIEETRALCLEFPNREMTAATNNWEIGKRIVKRLELMKVSKEVR
jgi:hypothetical protein